MALNGKWTAMTEIGELFVVKSLVSWLTRCMTRVDHRLVECHNLCQVIVVSIFGTTAEGGGRRVCTRH